MGCVSKSRTGKPRIYFAGKIGKNDWRHDIVPGLRGAALDPDNADPETDPFNPHLQIDCRSYVYCGPFFVSCDHGCAHGPNTHGVGNGGCIVGFDDQTSYQLHSKVFAINALRLRSADLVFAYLESATAYGSLIELGMAQAHGIPIGLRLPPTDSADLWMAFHAATAVFEGAHMDCWEQFRRRFGIGPDGR
jgi:hypothetical protein